MNRNEALRILGLDNKATAEDIKVAYKEAVQILHPDRFSQNKKLQNRATEQFKNLQEAYEYLKGSNLKSEDTGSSTESLQEVEARLAGIVAARIQLIKQRDVCFDQRRSGITLIIIGGIVAFITGRRPFGLFGFIAAVASAAVVWGVVQVVSSQRLLSSLTEHIKKLTQEKKNLEDMLQK